MINEILNVKGVKAMNKSHQKSIKGGSDYQTAGDVQAFLACLRNGGINCGAHVH